MKEADMYLTLNKLNLKCAIAAGAIAGLLSPILNTIMTIVLGVTAYVWSVYTFWKPAHEPKFTEDLPGYRSDKVICADCGKTAFRWIEDKSSRQDGHCGCWADCEHCDTITGVAECPCEEETPPPFAVE